MKAIPIGEMPNTMVSIGESILVEAFDRYGRRDPLRDCREFIPYRYVCMNCGHGEHNAKPADIKTCDRYCQYVFLCNGCNEIVWENWEWKKWREKKNKERERMKEQGLI